MSDSITVAFRTGALGRMSVPEMPVGGPPTREARESAAKSLFGPRGTQRRASEVSDASWLPPERLQGANDRRGHETAEPQAAGAPRPRAARAPARRWMAA